MIQFKNSKLIGLGSPWIKSGLLYDCWEKRNERDDRLVLRTPAAAMNPLIAPEELAREQANDPTNFRREFLAEWLNDVDSFLPDSDINAAIRSGVHERAPVDVYKGSYCAALDASGLSGRDRFTLAIAHKVARGSKENVTIEFDALKPGYEFEQTLTGDLSRYADAKEAINAFLEKREPHYTGE